MPFAHFFPSLSLSPYPTVGRAAVPSPTLMRTCPLASLSLSQACSLPLLAQEDSSVAVISSPLCNCATGLVQEVIEAFCV